MASLDCPYLPHYPYKDINHFMVQVTHRTISAISNEEDFEIMLTAGQYNVFIFSTDNHGDKQQLYVDESDAYVFFLILGSSMTMFYDRDSHLIGIFTNGDVKKRIIGRKYRQFVDKRFENNEVYIIDPKPIKWIPRSFEEHITVVNIAKTAFMMSLSECAAYAEMEQKVKELRQVRENFINKKKERIAKKKNKKSPNIEINGSYDESKAKEIVNELLFEEQDKINKKKQKELEQSMKQQEKKLLKNAKSYQQKLEKERKEKEELIRKELLRKKELEEERKRLEILQKQNITEDFKEETISPPQKVTPKKSETKKPELKLWKLPEKKTPKPEIIIQNSESQINVEQEIIQIPESQINVEQDVVNQIPESQIIVEPEIINQNPESQIIVEQVEQEIIQIPEPQINVEQDVIIQNPGQDVIENSEHEIYYDTSYNSESQYNYYQEQPNTNMYQVCYQPMYQLVYVPVYFPVTQ